MTTLFDLKKSVAVVTGATKGIGRAIVERLAEHGGRVVVASRTFEDCERVARELDARYGPDTAAPCVFDLNDRGNIGAPIETALARWGRIDTLISNAAVITYGALDSVHDSDFDLSFGTNVRNNAACAKAALPAMRAQGGGSIVYVISTVGLFPSPPYLTYSLGKAALAHMTQILAVDFGPDNVRVNGIVPGLIKTHSTSRFTNDPKMVARAIGKTPLGRMGEPDEIAAVAVLLASPGGAYITGQLIVVDGGQIHQGREAARSLVEGDADIR